MGVTTVVKDYGTAILNAIRDNDLKALRLIFEKQLKSDNKISALCVTDIKHKPTKKFACPLILAARQEDPAIIKYMMDHGVDPNFVHHTIYTSKRREVVTALHIAVDLGLFATVEVLLNANADPNIADHNDETSLHIAVKKADRVMTRMLLAKGADSSALDRRGNAPLHIVTLYGHLQLVKTLLKYDADVYQQGHLGAIPSHIAAREGHIHLIQVFCSRDAGNINIKIPCFADQREKAPIHLAAENGHVETVLALLDQFNAEVNLRDSDGNTPLHCTVLNPYHPYKMREKDYFYATAKALIKYRVAINEKNKYGETALHLAAANHYQKIVELLLSVGANPFAENDQHLKPIDVVPETDPVTKQLLKNAMTNQRTAPPLNASMLSLQRDLNLSAMGLGLPPSGNSRLYLPNANGILPHMQHQQFRGNASIRSASSMSSVFVDDARGKHHGHHLRSQKGTLQSQKGETKHREERENEIQTYNEERAKQKRESRERRKQRTNSDSVAGSTMSLNSMEDSTRHADRHRSRHNKPSTVERQNAKNERRTKEHRNRAREEEEEEEEEVFQEASPVITPSKNRHRRQDHPVYENLRSPVATREHERERDKESKRARRERREREKQEAEEAEQALVPYGTRDGFMFGENEGVKVHTIPGKPSMIEVQYDRGPIMISVDTQGDGFEALPPYDPLVIESDGEYSWDDGEDEESLDVSQNRSRRTKEVDAEEEKKKRRNQKTSRHGKDKDVDSNQERVQEEVRHKQRLNELLKRRKSIEERETKMREDAERRREEQEEAERQARKDEEKERKQAKKLLRRKLRQEQFEQEQEFEGMPTEEEPPERPFVVELPEEVLNEPSFDSDSFELEQESSRAALIVSTQRRMSETTESLKKRWSSHDEDENEDEETASVDRQSQPATGESGTKVPMAARRPFKPPRPSVSQTSVEMAPALVVSDEEQADETHAIIVEGREIQPKEVRARKVHGQEIPSAEVSHYQSFQAQLKETNKMEIIRMETVMAEQVEPASNNKNRSKEKEQVESTSDNKKKSSEEELIAYDQEPAFLRSSRNAPSPSEGIRHGLNMRVTGEVPKAYNRKEKSSARTAFMLAAPVGIESSSEASDSEFGSRTSLTKSPALEKISREWSEPLKPVYGKGHPAGTVPDSDSQNLSGGKYSTKGSGKLIGAYAKPYQSFGTIETKTDALEEAILEAEQKELERLRQLEDSLNLSRDSTRYGHELSTFSANTSTDIDAVFESNIPNKKFEGSGLQADRYLLPSVPDVISSSAAVTAQGQTSVVQGSSVPVVSQVKETDIDFFDDETFDDDEETASVRSETIHKATDQVSNITDVTRPSADELKNLQETGSVQVPPPIRPDLNKSVDSQRSVHDDLESYEREPGARKPRSRTAVKPDLKKASQEPTEKDSSADLQPEDDEVAMINSERSEKPGAKTGKKSKKTHVKNLLTKDESLEQTEEQQEEKGTGGKKAKTKQKKSKRKNFQATEEDEVWKEVLEGEPPLASSEMFERTPSITEQFVPLNLQGKNLRRDDILAGSEEMLAEMPERKKKDKKKQDVPKNAALVTELQKNFRFKQQEEELDDTTQEELSISNNLDIIIPPIGSKWKELQEESTESFLDVNIPLSDAMYFKAGDAEANLKWKPVQHAPGTKGFVNLDEIIIPGQSDDSFSPGRDKNGEERIMGRRQERLSKQGQRQDTDRGRVEQVTNLDDLSSPEDESSYTLDSEINGGLPSWKGKAKTGVRSKKTQQMDDETLSQTSDVKTVEESFVEDLDPLPPNADAVIGGPRVPVVASRAVPAKPKASATTPQVVKPPKPQKPSYLVSASSASAAAKEAQKSLPLVPPQAMPLAPKPLYPAKRQIPPMSNGVGPASDTLGRPYSAGAEIVEMSSRGEGIRYITDKPETTRSRTGHALPRLPPSPIGASAIASDTEIGQERRVPAPKYGRRLVPAHSEAEASDLEMPVAPGPGKSYRQAALETINRRPRPTFVLRQPGHHDKSFGYIRKLYKPQTRHSVTRHLMPTAGRYGDSELIRTSRRSATESEGDTDNEYSYLYNERGQDQMRRGVSPAGRGRGKVVTIQEGMARRRRPGYISREDKPPRIMEPGPVDFRKFDVIARMWMEQVDHKTVQKSQTMYLSVLPQGHELPEEMIRRAKYPSALANDSSTVPLQWVMARSRAAAHKSRAAGEPRVECGNLSGYESDLNIFRPSSPNGRQLILFFKVGSNWLDLAWVLFDGLQGDSETVRMIKDIQLKNPDSLTEQVHDLMHRWWKKKGDDATIEELQKALDTVHLAYIHEEYFDAKTSFVPHTDTEDDLDVGEVSDSDPNVSRLVQEYEVRSLNASFVNDAAASPAQELDPEMVLRTLQKAKAVAPGSTALYTRASRTSRAESRDSSLDRSTSRPAVGLQSSQDKMNASSDDEKKQQSSNILLQKLRNSFKHETNL